jgi:nucleotide-binding universal stress UspA family protein
MKPIERILAAVDLSDLSDEVLRAAYFLAQKVKGKLTALHVVNQSPFEGHFFGPSNLNLVDQLERQASEELNRRVAELLGEDAEINAQVNVGVPYVDLLRFAKQQKVQFLVAGSHGKTGLQQFLLGSVAEALMRKAECPVWVVRGAFSPPQKILLLTDLSQPARAGFNYGLFFAKLLGASVHLLHVFEPPYVPSFAMIDPTEYELKMREMDREEFQKWVEEARLSKVEVHSDLIEGRVAHEVEEVVKKEKIDLMIMSTHGQSGLFHKHLGSVTTQLARHVPCSLITVRPEGFRFKEIV